MSIKLINLTGRLISKLFRVSSGFFRLIFGGFFYKILVKIYYGGFRLKKNDLANKTVGELSRNRLAYLFMFVLTLILILFNLLDQEKTGDAETKISKTVMASLIPSEFGSLPNEELIEEGRSLNSLLSAGKEKYLADSCTLEKTLPAASDTDAERDNQTAFNEDGDLIFKPLMTTAKNGDSGATAQARTTIITYTVQNGDTVSTIARKFGLTINTILWANNLNSYGLIRPGDDLTILPYSGILYTVKSGDTVSRIASKYGVEIDKILSCNNLEAGLKIGQKIMVPGAKKIVETTRVASSRSDSSYTGLSAIRDLIKSPTVKASGGKMAWPTQGFRISQYFSWRHNGVDIANKVGTPIYAAESGVVEIARGGYNGGYGNTIVINHGGGKKTRYGHASKLFVKVGDEVEKGENIAAMGSTGRSTGSHLHFEVLINGVRYNPLNYIR